MRQRPADTTLLHVVDLPDGGWLELHAMHGHVQAIQHDMSGRRRCSDRWPVERASQHAARLSEIARLAPRTGRSAA